MSNESDFVLDLGYGNFVVGNRFLGAFDKDSASIRKWVDEKQIKGKVVSATKGRAAKTVLLMDSGDVVLCALDVGIVRSRYLKGRQQDT